MKTFSLAALGVVSTQLLSQVTYDVDVESNTIAFNGVMLVDPARTLFIGVQWENRDPSLSESGSEAFEYVSGGVTYGSFDESDGIFSMVYYSSNQGDERISLDLTVPEDQGPMLFFMDDYVLSYDHMTLIAQSDIESNNYVYNPASRGGWTADPITAAVPEVANIAAFFGVIVFSFAYSSRRRLRRDRERTVQ